MTQQPASLRDQAYGLFQSGRLAEAQRTFEAWCRDHPDDTVALCTLGIAHGMQSSWGQAEACLRQAIAADPSYGDAHTNLGVVLEARNQFDAALASYREALRLTPAQPDLHHNIGIILNKLDQRTQAIDHFRSALRIKPDFVEAHCSLGAALEVEQDYSGAEASYRTAIRLDPRHADSHYNLGNVLRAQDKQREATACYEAAIRLNPKHASAHNNFGNALTSLKEHSRAADCFREVLRLNPQHIGALTNLGTALTRLNDYTGAIELFEQVLKIQPEFTPVINSLGLTYFEQNLTKKALECFERVLQIDPDDPSAHANIGWVHAKGGRFAQAIPHFKKSLQVRPDASLYASMGHTLNYEGRLEEALECFKEGHRLNPSLSSEGYLFSMNYNPKFTPQEIFEEHKRWGEIFAQVPDPLPPLPADTRINRPLRVGYVTPDLREHSVAYFFEPILTYHDRAGFETFCYVEISQPKFDATSERLEALSGHWINTWGLSDRELAERIRADGIDILVDLAGHTGNNRLLAFAYRPAPVQITYLGYCNTTGLPAVQYRLTDEWADPPGQEQFNTEELVRLPRGFLTHLPPANLPPVSDSPASTLGHITFGSFNIIAKTTPEVVTLWTDILKAIPDARLIMKNRSMRDADTRDRYYQMFQERGIARERVDLIGWLPEHDSHLALYSRIDIGLDTFPYNGTTTTCEALWMGVPVICLAGDRHAARVGVSLLSRLGLTELIAETPQDYLELARRLSKDIPHLTELRHSLRARILASTLGDGAAFTRELEKTYRDLWRRRCDKISPAPGNRTGLNRN